MKRRDFFKSAGLTAVAGLGFPGESVARTQPVSIKKYGVLGKTGLKIGDISFGCGDLSSPSLVARAVDMGVNYFDTAPDYGPSETTLGKFIKQSPGVRAKIGVASKFCAKSGYPGHLHAGDPQSDYISAVEGSLKRMNTDYLDVVFVHAMGEKSRGYEERLFSENMLNAFEKLKNAGKVRFLAVSSHGPNRMEELMMKAVKSGHYDIIQPAHNFMKFPNTPEVIKEAGRRNVGVIAMKTLAGAKEMGLDPKGEPFAHAAFKWVLKNPNIAGLIVTISNARNLAHYVEASGQPFTKKSQLTLDRYMTAYSSRYCRTGCGQCLSACPDNVDVAGILRQEMYFSDYHQEKRAMQSYAAMEPKADNCSACAGAPCEAACPYDLPVRKLMGKANELLSFQT
ncbi:Ferredoxin [hydrothermal vent metagenome]|uniref:Ferredoxin n=1 Tax=hydrothermal vent metagenome TaxID=652676 RepID=A0A3B1CHB4_9ZZZZ